ncbi:MAG: efflux RND transporter permease subunit [Spirochaetes bacterium]|nr:efflux RND transporter permease subunit [Spirochaetota bacterium]
MKNLNSWLERKKAALCILAGICSVSLFVIINSSEKIKNSSGGSYVVKIRHYGIDAAEMERSITIPLEDALFAIPGVMSVQSSSENNLSNVFIRFKNERKGRYEAVRDAAQRVYETLPSSVQRPEIISSNNSRIPVWSAAVYSGNSVSTAQMLEKVVKPRLESLEGAGEVIVSGAGLKEIFIILDQEKLSLLGLQPSAAAAALGMNDAIFPGGSIIHQNREIFITVDGRFGITDSQIDISSLERVLVPFGDGKSVELSEIAVITEQERTPDILSRLNGRKTAGIAIMGRHETDLRRLSLDIKKELSALAKDRTLPLEFTVLSDIGAEETAAFRSVVNAALTGAVMVAVISFLLKSKNNANFSGLFCALAIPFICLVSAAILSISGFTINRLMLAGIAAGIGSAVDAVILCSEKLRKCRNYTDSLLALQEIKGPLIAGAATTVAALIPLMAIEDSGAGIIAVSIAVVTLTALLMSLSLLPPLLLWENKGFITDNLIKLPRVFKLIQRRILRFLCRVLAVNAKFCICYPLIILSVSLALTVLAILALFAKGADIAGYASENSVYAQVEFEGGLLIEETDLLLAAYGEKLAGNAGITNVETGARTGSGSLLVSFDPKQTKAHLVRDLAKQISIPGGFVFFHENSLKDRYWEIKIFGDEDKKCRELAEELAFICAGHPIIRERVLNFKQGSRKIVFLPDRELFAESGITFSNAASMLRLGVYGPVAYKRMGADGETDVRILTGGSNLLDYGIGNVLRQSKEGALGILVSAGEGETVSSLHIDSLMQIKEETEPSSIRRDDRRRTASITITTKPMDPRRVKEMLSGLIEKLNLPPGYSVEFDPEAIRQAQALSSTVISLVLAVIFCYMIIASINDSFTIPLIVLSAIPPSLSLPALCLVLSGSAYNSAVACAFIAVSGMTVNAAVLCADGLRSKMHNEKTALGIYTALRRKMPALLATAGTTVAGAIPFLFLKEGANILIRTLSLTGALGVTCSCLCSITVIPSLFIISRKNLYKKNNPACAGYKS